MIIECVSVGLSFAYEDANKQAPACASSFCTHSNTIQTCVHDTSKSFHPCQREERGTIAIPMNSGGYNAEESNARMNRFMHTERTRRVRREKKYSTIYFSPNMIITERRETFHCNPLIYRWMRPLGDAFVDQLIQLSARLRNGVHNRSAQETKPVEARFFFCIGLGASVGHSLSQNCTVGETVNCSMTL